MNQELNFDDFPVQLHIDVQWGDMDAAKHVNNLIYLRWSESARIEYFKQMGMEVSFGGLGAGPILGWQDCKYIFPMTFPDTALVGIKVSGMKEDRIMMDCRIFSKKNERIAAITNQIIIPYDYVGLKKMDLPDEWLNAIQEIEQPK